jgi:hypothetical protein
VADETVKEIEYAETKIELPQSVIPTETTVHQWLFTKFRDWRYEQEWRGWASLSEMEDGHFFVPFGKDTLELAEVITGCRCAVRRTDIVGALIGHDRTVIVKTAVSSASSFQMVEDEAQTFTTGAAEAAV